MWGTFSNLRVFCMSASLRSVLEAAIYLRFKLKRIPSKKQYAEHDIPIEIAIKYFKTKKNLESFLSDLLTKTQRKQ